MAAANVLASHSGRRLYGDLLNAILLSVMLPFVTHKVIETISGGEYGILSSDSSSLIAEKEETAEISHVRVLLQWLSGAVSALFSGVAFYYSWHRLNDASIVHSTEEQKQESFQSSTSSRVVATKSSGLDIGMLAERWSYASFGASTAAMIIGTINNWPHVDEQTLVTHFIWRLVVISANISYSLKVKLIMAGINLLVALVLVTVCSQLYPLATFGPLLLAITGTRGMACVCVLEGRCYLDTERPTLEGQCCCPFSRQH
jgi:hypothetical protein